MGADETVSRFLQVSAAYMFGAAYCANLRAAFARSAPRDPVSEQALRYRELITREVSGLMRERLEEERRSHPASAKRVPIEDALEHFASP
jgi:hypothetical protein